MIRGYQKECDEVEQTLGKALGYPWFKDDQKNFPDATELNGVCVGEHTPASIAAEAAKEILALRQVLDVAREINGWLLQEKMIHSGHGRLLANALDAYAKSYSVSLADWQKAHATRTKLHEPRLRPELDALLAKARAKFEAMSPEEQEKLLKEQRDSWVRGNLGIDP